MQHASHALLHLLDMYVCEDEAEEVSVAFTKDMLLKHPDIWLQSCEAGHITGSGLILDRTNKKILLMHHRKLDLWLQMGGHGENEFDPSQIALREAREESGLTDLHFFPEREGYPTLVDVDAHLIPAHVGAPEHYHLDFRYLFSTQIPDTLQPVEAEAKEVCWFAFPEISALRLKPATLRLVNKAKRLCL